MARISRSNQIKVKSMHKKLVFLLIMATLFTIGCSLKSKIDLPQNSDVVYNLYVDEKGGIWQTAFNSQYINKLKNDLSVEYSLRRPGLVDIALIENGVIWAFDTSLLARSHDNGKIWECFSKSPFKECDKIVSDNQFQMTSKIVSNKGTFFLGTYDGIYRSIDNGNTWQGVYVSSRVGDNTVFDIFIQNEIVYASVRIPMGNDNPYGEIVHGVVESSDDGQTWNVTWTGKPIDEFIGHSKSGKIYAFQSPDSVLVKDGNEWKVLSYLPIKNVKEERCDFKFSISPNGDLWASCSLYTEKYEGGDFPIIRRKGAHLMRSVDEGNIWQEVDIGKDVKFVSDIDFLPSGDLIIATNSGLIKRTVT